jgi:hypothetical protein
MTQIGSSTAPSLRVLSRRRGAGCTREASVGEAKEKAIERTFGGWGIEESESLRQAVVDRVLCVVSEVDRKAGSRGRGRKLSWSCRVIRQFRATA